jgi:hypothetical protein
MFNKRLSLRWRLIRTYPDLTPYTLTAGNLVTYRDLALDPAMEIRRLMQWIGLEYEPTQLEYWNFEHFGTQKRAYEWVKEKKTKLFDTRWKTELPAALQARVRAMCC